MIALVNKRFSEYNDSDKIEITWDLIQSRNHFFFFLKKAQNGDPMAQYVVARCYRDGHTISINYEMAFFWGLKSAMQGNTNAMILVGQCYRQGNGVPKHHQKAVVLFQESVKKGNQKAKYYLGLCYEKGLGILKNTEIALQFFFNLVDSLDEVGRVLALYHLGSLHKKGTIVEKNISKAIQYYITASEEGNPYAENALDEFPEEYDDEIKGEIISQRIERHGFSFLFSSECPTKFKDLGRVILLLTFRKNCLFSYLPFDIIEKCLLKGIFDLHRKHISKNLKDNYTIYREFEIRLLQQKGKNKL